MPMLDYKETPRRRGKHHIKDVKRRKVWIKAYLVEALGLHPKLVARLFSPRWYKPADVLAYLQAHGYRPGKAVNRKKLNDSSGLR